MCMGSPSIPETETVEVPEASPTPPSPEPVAEAPDVDEGTKRTGSRGTEGNTSKRGSSALRIDLNLARSGGAGGLNIPQG